MRSTFPLSTFSRLLLLLAVFSTWGLAQQDDPAEEEEKQKLVVQRFLTVLEKSPRRGTALDRVYGHHVEWGTLDKFLDGLRAKTKANPKDGPSWMILGLIESQRGQDAAAVEALQKAEGLLAQNAMASYYLGQSLVLVGQPELAVEAFERALTRKPAQADLLEIFQQLGRVHQRAQRTDKALEVWARLEKLFPNDPRVQEQIAVTLVEEGQPALALPRYEALAKITKDDYRKTVYRMEAAELKVKLGQKEKGLADLETLLAGLNPDSWLHRDVRRRIEDVFMRSDDQDGLVKYYEKWIGAHADDVDSMARLARILARSARVPEATVWLDKALKLAPSRKELRLAFVEQLVDDQRFAEAVKQFEALDKAEPNNPDYVREWGKLILKDKSQTIEARKGAAEKVWRKLLASRPKDALITTQVADLFRQTELTAQALELYEKAVELAPDDPQYREYLGEYYHILKRPKDAMATWKEIATGKRRTAENVARLAEVYNGFGYMNEAVAEIASACKLDAKDFSLQLKAAEYHTRAEKYAEALKFVDAADKLAADVDEKESALVQRIKVYQAGLELDERITALEKSVKGNAKAKAEDWFLLARYYESDRQFAEASQAIAQALKIDPQSVPSLATAARIEEQGGNLSVAAELNRKLAAVDRRFRSDYLTNVSRLEAQLGRTDAALQAGRDLIASAPGNTEHYEYFAQLCFRLGKTDDGLEALRRAVRINPTEPKLALTLAAALAEQLRTDEAIQIYWQAFDKSEEIEDKANITMKLAELHLQLNQFDKLIERMERDRREEEKRRAMTICLAQAHHTSGDYGTARQELESLLNSNTRDTTLLQQLSKLAEAEQDLASAVKYQEQLAKVAPGPESEYRLATLLQSAGQNEESTTILVKLTQREQDPERVLKSLDSLLNAARFDVVLAVTEPLLREQPRNWELLYREAVAWASQGKTAEASIRFQRLLDLPTPLEDLGVAAAARKKQAQAKAKSNNTAGRRRTAPTAEETIFTHLGDIYRIRFAVGLQSEDYYGGQQSMLWMPQNYAATRTACLGWQFAFAQKELKDEAFLAALKKKIDVPKPDRSALLDWVFLQTLRNSGADVYQAAKKLALAGDLASQQFFLGSVAARTQTQVEEFSNSSDGGVQPVDTTPPLPADELELVLSCYRNLSKQNADPNTTAYYATMSGLQTVATELKRAKRESEAEALFKESISKATRPSELLLAFSSAATRDDFNGSYELLDKWCKAQLAEPAKLRSGNYWEGPAESVNRVMGLRGGEKAHADVLKLLDRYLDYAAVETAERRAQATRKTQSSTGMNSGGMYVSLWYGKQQTSGQIDYPGPGQYVDYGSLMILREAQEVYQRNDLLSDLVDHMQKRAASAPANTKISAQMLLASLLWWTDEREQAVAEFTAAAKLVPQDIGLQLDMAMLQNAQGNHDDALAMVDAITPLDQQTLQRRELLALQLAERLGDTDRARTAAERLFGLRLDAATQMSLAGRMRRLGMENLAESVMARVQRQAGNQTSALLTLMTTYQGQGKTDLAIQLAHTVLRRSQATTASRMNRLRGYYDENYNVRQQALQFLQQTGSLKEIIARVEGQLKQSPDAPQLYQTLAEYYEIAGERDKGLELLDKMLKLRPEDYVFRTGYAKQLLSAGKTSEACDQYVILLEKRPDLISNNFYEVQNAFNRANRAGDLAKAFDKMDLKSFRNPWYIVDTATNLLRDEKTRDVGLRLFKKAFAAFPSYRTNLVNRIYDEDVWKIPDVYEIAKQGLIPNSSSAAIQPWHGMNEIYSYGGDGKASGISSSLLTAATRVNKLELLRKDVEAGVTKFPGWSGGKALLAVIDFKLGKKDEAKAAMQTLLADKEVMKSLTPEARWLLGQEIEDFGSMQDVVILLYQGAFEGPRASQNEFSYSPGMRLVKIYTAAGKKEEARKLLLTALNRKFDNQYDHEYNAYRRVQGSLVIGEQFQKLDFPIETIKVCRDLLNNPDQLRRSSSWNGEPQDYYVKRVRTLLQKALESLTGEKATVAVVELLKPAAKADQVVDLMLTQPDNADLEKSQFQSPFVALLRTVGKEPRVNQVLRDQVQELAKTNPQDLSAQITASLVLLSGDDPAKSKQSVESLLACVDALPLEAIPDGKRANARQRTEASRQVPLWLVARECLEKPELKPAGEKLAERALAASRRQIDGSFTTSILHEWGELALKAGDKPTAEARWSELLELATKRPKTDKKPARPATGATPAPVPAAAPAVPAAASPAPPPAAFVVPRSPANSQLNGGPVTARVRSILAPAFLILSALQSAPAKPISKPAAEVVEHIPPISVSQFQLAMQVARLAAKNDMPALSLKAVRESLKGGAPLPDLPADEQSRGRRVISSGLTEANAEETGPLVGEALISLSQVWLEKKYAPTDVYAMLRPIVFPADRQGEILLYAKALNVSGSQQESLGLTLVAWAKSADQLPDLQAAIAARQKSPIAKLPAQVLLCQIALATEDRKAAVAQLQLLNTLVKTETVPANVQLACHVAMQAYEDPQLSDLCVPILEKTLAQLANSGRDDLQSLTRKLIQVAGRKNDRESARKQIENYLIGRQRRYAQYGGDYALYLQRVDLSNASLDASRAGLPELGLEYLGRYADSPAYRYNDAPIERPVALVMVDLLNKPAAERYELLSKWTLPAEKRRTVRSIAAWTERTSIPALFVKSKHAGAVAGGPASAAEPPRFPEYFSSLTMLVQAAKEVGKLEELAIAARKAADEKLINAKFLVLLVEVARGDKSRVEPLINELASTVADRNKVTDQQRGTSIWPDYLAARACLETPQFAPLAWNYASGIRSGVQGNQQWAFITHLRRDFFRSMADPAALTSSSHALPGSDPGLKLWSPSTPFGQTLWSFDPWWLAHEGQVMHVGGLGHDMLYFNYPLEGEFEFSVDAFNGGWAEGDVGYGGIVVEAQHQGNNTSVWPVGQHETIGRPDPKERAGTGFNRITVQVKPGKLRYLLNNYLVYEEQIGRTSPWLHLYAHYPRQTFFRNFKLTGQPVIPREVMLTDGHHLDGWISSHFGETQPRRRLMAEKLPEGDPDEDYNIRRAYEERERESKVFDWNAVEGVIAGRRQGDRNSTAQSRLYYHRPLASGDVMSYEFFYQPGETEVHPAIGRLAFLLEPTGTRLHWMSRPWEEEVLAVEPNNVASDPQLVSPHELPLKAGEWNAATVSLTDGLLTISLNGVAVCKRPMEPDNERHFGFFHFKGRSSVKVRNVVLKGNWPEQLTAVDLQNLNAPAADVPQVERHAKYVAMNMQHMTHDALDVLVRTASLPDAERYEVLKGWVLPGLDHPNIRTFMAQAPAGQAQRANITTAVDAGPGGGSIVAPILELLALAKKLNKLEETAAIINAGPSGWQHETRCKLTAQALQAMTAGDYAAAESRMQELYKFIEPILPPETGIAERTPEYVCILAATNHPPLRRIALDMAQTLLDKHNQKSGGNEWDQLVRHLRGLARWKLDVATAGVKFGRDLPASSQWIPASYQTLHDRGLGRAAPGWRVSRGVAEVVPGQVQGALYFQVPLKGDFEITGVRTTVGWMETHLAYAGISVEPAWDLKGTTIATLVRGTRRIDQPVNVPEWGNQFANQMRFKIVVKNGLMTTSANGVELPAEAVPQNPDPWIQIQPAYAGYSGSVRNLRITGNPQVPAEIAISEISNLQGWQADYFADSLWGDPNVDNPNVSWIKKGDEIVGRLQKNTAASHVETVLQYYRPLVEDGEIEYEFFWVPGKTEVFPAVDRAAFLLSPEGVKLHELTDAQYEQLGRTADNASDIPGSAKSLPLKANDWNVLKLKFQRAAVEVLVNGAVAASYPLPPDNRRVFGLFRYADQSDCRVRKVVMRGAWPKSLPKVEDQELAFPPEGPFSLLSTAKADKPVSVVMVQLNQPKDVLEKLGFKLTGSERMKTETGGLRITLPADDPQGGGNDPALYASVDFSHAVSGDFEAVLKFRNLKLTAPNAGYGSGVEINLDFQTETDVRLSQFERRVLKDGRHVLHAMTLHKGGNGQDKYAVPERTTSFDSGRLKIVRKGSRLHYMFAPDGQEFELMSTLDGTPGDLRGLRFPVRTSSKNSSADVLLEEISIRAEKIAR